MSSDVFDAFRTEREHSCQSVGSLPPRPGASSEEDVWRFFANISGELGLDKVEDARRYI